MMYNKWRQLCRYRRRIVVHHVQPALLSYLWPSSHLSVSVRASSLRPSVRAAVLRRISSRRRALVVVLNTSAGPRRAHASYTSHHIVNSTVFIHTHISVDITSKYYFKTNDMTKSIACEVPAAYLSALNAVFLFAISNKKSRVLESLIHANVNGLPRFVYTYSTVIAVSH